MAAAPLDLPRLVMRRAAAVALAVLLLALGLGLARMGHDIDDEVDAAFTLARLMGALGSLAQADDIDALAALRAMQAEHPPRHLLLRVQTADGRLLLGPPPLPSAEPPLSWLLGLHRKLLSAPEARQVSWEIARPGGVRWTVTLVASHESERREAMVSLIGMLLLLLGCIAGLLLVMQWNVRRAFAPLGRVLAAIAGIELHDARAVQTLPTMPINELEAVAGALRHLGAALESAEAQRRLLSQQVLTLQEDERARLARELHDEFGQRLTALRVDAAWLARRLVDQPVLSQVVDGMAAQCDRVQQDIRALLTRLQPLAAAGGGDATGESLARLAALLHALVASWAQPGRDAVTACRLELSWQGDDGLTRAWPEAREADALRLPRALVLALYRISQEALTNVARHAQASIAVLQLHCTGTAAPGSLLHIDWSVSDDGVGLPAAGGATEQGLGRGNGIAGIQQRVWAQGGDLRTAPAHVADLRPGLRLEASFSMRLMADDAGGVVRTRPAGP